MRVIGHIGWEATFRHRASYGGDAICRSYEKDFSTNPKLEIRKDYRKQLYLRGPQAGR